MNILFNLLRVLSGLTSSAALLILLAIVLLHSSLVFAKESVGALAYVARLFTSGFTEGTAPEAPAGWIVALPQVGLSLLFAAMLVSVFLPGTKILLHVIAALAGLALLWYLQMIFTELRLEIFCLPALILWFAYYAMCLFLPSDRTLTMR